jgi:hypothetical protein
MGSVPYFTGPRLQSVEHSNPQITICWKVFCGALHQYQISSDSRLEPTNKSCDLGAVGTSMIETAVGGKLKAIELPLPREPPVWYFSLGQIEGCFVQFHNQSHTQKFVNALQLTQAFSLPQRMSVVARGDFPTIQIHLLRTWMSLSGSCLL